MTIDLTVTSGIGTIILDRPPVNALNREHQRLLHAAATEVTRRTDVRAVLICGAGDVFCAGADIAEMKALPPEAMAAHAPTLQASITAVAEIPVPVCAAIEKYALGGGLELALAADFRICGTGAQLGLPETNLGVIPGAGGTQRLPQLIGKSLAKLAVMLGGSFRTEEAETMGLVEDVVPAGLAVQAAYELVEKLATRPRAALIAAKQAINAASSPEGLRIETELFAGLFGTPDQVEGMAAFLEKRKPNFK